MDDLCFSEPAKVYHSSPWVTPANVIVTDFKYGSDDYVCQCNNGRAAIGLDCPFEDSFKCKSCDSGFTLNTSDNLCAANICVCPNGNPVVGSACTINGATQCASCGSGYSLLSDNSCVELLKRNTFIGTVTSTPNFDVSFGLHLFGTVSGWSNVLHVTQNSINEYRLPMVSFAPNSYEVLFDFGTNCNGQNGWEGSHNRWWNNDFGWQTGEYHTIKINGTEVDNDPNASHVKIFIDDIMLHETTKTGLCFGGQAELYASHNFYKAADLGMVNLEYYYQDRFILKRNTLIDTITTSPNFEISFGIKLLGTVSGWSNLLHITTGTNNVRLPSLYFKSNTYEFHCHFGQNYNNWWKKNFGWQTGEFHTIKITGTEVDDGNDSNASSTVKVFIDGILSYEDTVSDNFGESANIYASNDFVNPANAEMIDLKYEFL